MDARNRDFLQMTEQVKLTKELVSLVHYVELNESGWVKKTLQKIILAVLRARSAGAVTSQELREEVREATTHDFGAKQIDAAIDSLLSDKKLIKNVAGKLQLRQEAIREIDEATAATTSEETAAKERFVGLIRDAAPGIDADALWVSFENDYLYPLIAQSGANTLNLISGGDAKLPTEGLSSVMEAVPEDLREQVTHAVIEFLDPSNDHARQFILKRVAATFFVGAVSLEGTTIDALDKKRTRKSAIKLFLDTNTLFSVLSLHDNDENDSVQSLMAMNRNAHSPVQLKLFVFPETIEEATRVLSASMNHLGSHPIPANLARVGKNANLSGVFGRYFKAAAESNMGLSPREYFEPYITGLTGILKTRGIEVIDRSLQVSATDQALIDDVLEMQEHESRKAEDRRKNYDAIRHDVFVWHCVERARPAGLASPLDASEWFVTLDKRLMGFDAFKRGGRKNYVPICIDPSSFIQYAQFWTPRSADFERALFGSLRLPLLFRDFDSDTEDVTMSILRRMATFETVHTFSTAELQTILLDRAVRTRFQMARSDEEEIEIIRDELLAVHESIVTENKMLQEEAKQKEALAGKHAGEAEEYKNQRDVAVEKVSQAETARIAALGKADGYGKEVAELKQQLAARDEETAEIKRKLQERTDRDERQDKLKAQRLNAAMFVLTCGVMPAVLASLVIGFAAMYMFRIPFPFGLATIVGLLVCGGCVWKFGGKHPALESYPKVRICAAVVGTVGLCAVLMLRETGSAIYQNWVQTNQDKLPDVIGTALGGAKAQVEEKR
ncbi:hypothetical protein [Pandoraea sp. PE-S2R-1]|uniref:hypothetical protein n=1 Tax=Pandoraea sp. PE-S2R-1 TaxID=1986994 RepID=UPI000B403C49|nr:hypothetical protein [Pandoraea sp. PE-S2R-1]